MNCIIVDDEPLARELLEQFVNKVPFLNLKALCSNAFQAMAVLNNDSIDLIFLDIQMPDLSGLQMYQSLQNKPQVIFTTAYSNYALEGFEVDATDYLLKPFTYERFMKAVAKAYDNYSKIYGADDSVRDKNLAEFLFVKDGTKTVKIILQDVLYMESMKDYIRIHTTEKTIVTLTSMQNMVDKLDPKLFARVHRSYIVSIAKIDAIERNRIVIGENWIPIGNYYKDAFKEILEHYH